MSTKKTDYYISFSDLWVICKRSKGKLALGILLMICLTGLYALTRPVEYTAQASFREKGKSQSGIVPNSFAFLLNSSSAPMNGEALSTLKCRSILEQLARQMGLQGDIKTKNDHRTFFNNFLDNLFIEYALFMGKKGPLFADRPEELLIREIDYKSELPLQLHLNFLSDDTFRVINPNDESQKIVGKIGSPVYFQGASFVIFKNRNPHLASKEFQLTLLPMQDIVKMLGAKLSIDTDREDKSLLNLKFKYSDRHQAALILNQLMGIYQDYLFDEQQRTMLEQVEYLTSRQDEVLNKLRKMMEDHAANLSTDVAATGFPDANSAMSFFAHSQQQYARELLAIELETRLLQQLQQSGGVQYEHSDRSSNSVINKIIDQIHQLRKQADSLELALKDGFDEQIAASEVSAKMTELSEMSNNERDAVQILEYLTKNKAFPPSQLIQNPQYKIKAWIERLMQCKNNSNDYDNCKKYFSDYLNNLIHLFHVHQQALREQLTHQQRSSDEFLGIDLSTAKELYLQYSRELSGVEAQIRQLSFVSERLDDPEFEISSLSSILEDSVSRDMIRKASDIVLALHDESNRSAKEQERLKTDLALQKSFLAVHLKQSQELQQLKKEVLKEKVISLQQTTLGLVQQELSVLQEHLADHISGRIHSLNHERSILQQHQKELQSEMAAIPNKWVAEKMIDQQMEIDRKMVEEVTKLVESKNISRNLEIIQSAPLDQAIVPVQPVPPRIALFMVIGAVSGLFISATGLLGFQMAKGIPLTAHNLQLSGYFVARKSQNGETLRRIGNFLTGKKGAQEALLITAGVEDYSNDLALLLSERGFKVVVIKVPGKGEETEKSLLDYLLRRVDFPRIEHHASFDEILFGKNEHFNHESINSQRFQKLLGHLKRDYDWILVMTEAKLNSSEAEGLFHLFPLAVLTITDETWHDFASYQYPDKVACIV